MTPQSAAAGWAFADGLLARRQYREAIEAYERLLVRHPERADGWFNLAYALRQTARFQPALDAYGKAMAYGAQCPEEIHLNRAAIYSDHLRNETEAERELLAALRCRPDHLPALLNLGNLHEERGDRTAARRCYERILTLSAAVAGSESLDAMARLLQMETPSALDDAVLGHARQMADRRVDSDRTARANLYFALGRCHDARGEIDAAFGCFAKGKGLAHQSLQPYDRQRARHLTDEIIESAQASAPGGQGDRLAPAPIFICGMFRSGSTLIERVLAGHPEIVDGGELELLPRLVRDHLSPFPQAMVNLNAARSLELAEIYRAQLPMRLRRPDPMVRWFTDKRPDNYALIGVILRLFPGARIVHTERDPLDNGLAIFMQHLNPRVLGYAGTLRSIGEHYVEYHRLMDFWKREYPSSIHGVRYENFVTEPEANLAALLSFLGLPMHEDCLRFDQRPGVVKTASYWQVRRPLNTDACGRWRRYRSHLGELVDALKLGGIELADE